jgi:hypothetical protein
LRATTSAAGLDVSFEHNNRSRSTNLVEMQYKQTGFYTPSADTTVACNDPAIDEAACA